MVKEKIIYVCTKKKDALIKKANMTFLEWLVYKCDNLKYHVSSFKLHWSFLDFNS